MAGRQGLASYTRVLSLAVLCVLTLASCAKIELPKHLRPVSKDAMMLLGAKKMALQAPIFIRIFKEESELEIWKKRNDGRFYHLKTYPICIWSGELGPKRKQGDKQAPEGFYTVKPQQMNPNSSYHLAFNLGYPNAYDRAHDRTGDFLMVHGKCTSAGCYAMTDPIIEEIYAFAREAFDGGQKEIHVHAFPFRMTEENMLRHIRNPELMFWLRLKEGYDYFEITRTPPKIAICNREYHVNVEWEGRKPKPRGLCPQFVRPELSPFSPAEGEEQLAVQRITVPGVKKRRFARRPLAPTSTYSWNGVPAAPNTAGGLSQSVQQQDTIGSLIRTQSSADIN